MKQNYLKSVALIFVLSLSAYAVGTGSVASYTNQGSVVCSFAEANEGETVLDVEREEYRITVTATETIVRYPSPAVFTVTIYNNDSTVDEADIEILSTAQGSFEPVIQPTESERGARSTSTSTPTGTPVRVDISDIDERESFAVEPRESPTIIDVTFDKSSRTENRGNGIIWIRANGDQHCRQVTYLIRGGPNSSGELPQSGLLQILLALFGVGLGFLGLLVAIGLRHGARLQDLPRIVRHAFKYREFEVDPSEGSPPSETDNSEEIHSKEDR